MQILHFCISVNQKTVHHRPHIRTKQTKKKVKQTLRKKSMRKQQFQKTIHCQSLKYQHLKSARDNCTFHGFSSSRGRKNHKQKHFQRKQRVQIHKTNI